MTVSPVAIDTSPVTQTLRAPNPAVSFGVILAVGIIVAASGSTDSAATSGLSPRILAAALPASGASMMLNTRALPPATAAHTLTARVCSASGKVPVMVDRVAGRLRQTRPAPRHPRFACAKPRIRHQDEVGFPSRYRLDLWRT